MSESNLKSEDTVPFWLRSDRIIKEAMFTDGTEEFRSPMEADLGETVCFHFRVAKDNVDEVHLVFNEEDLLMQLVAKEEYFDLYEGYITLKERMNRYYFVVRKRQEGKEVETCFYTAVGADSELKVEDAFLFAAGFHTPQWAKGAVFYQIFVDRFCNGDPSNDVRDGEYLYLGEKCCEVNKWTKYPSTMGVREFYGGDLLGIIKKLDYLKDLGVEVLYLNPIFVSPSNHKYDIQDYDYVDPHFGVIVNDLSECEEEFTSNQGAHRYIKRVSDRENLEESNQMLIRLVEEVHARGMHIILDGVFNHCGSFNKWLDREEIYEQADGYEKGAYQSEDSIYRSYFHFNEEKWPYNDSYEGWWGHSTLPKLNYEDSKELYDYIMQVARKWVSAPYNVDGWRLDVAADLGHSEEFNHQFWRDFRENVRMANPQALILAEHYGDASAWLEGDQWDSVMNYDAFMEPITWFLTGMEKHSDEFRRDRLGNEKHFIYSMNRYMARFQTQSLLVAMNELSNHDHSRFLTRTNHVVGRTEYLGPQAANENIDEAIFRIGVVMQFTWIGAPTIYYGDEAGVCGWTDPDNRRTFPWGDENREFIALHKELIRIHSSYDVLRYGSIKILYGEQDVIVYGRFHSTDHFVIAVNVSDQEKQFEVPVWQIGILDHELVVKLLETTKEGYHREAQFSEVNNGMLHLRLLPKSSVVVKNYVPYQT